MLIQLHVSVKQLILSKKKIIADKIINDFKKFHFFSKKILITIKLLQNELLH